MGFVDRRLLAYNDGAAALCSTASWRTCIEDYQRELSEVQRELCKYQLLLSGAERSVKTRAREQWIVEHRAPKSVKHLYRHAAHRLGVETHFSEEVHDSHAERQHPPHGGSQGTPGRVRMTSGSDHEVDREHSAERRAPPRSAGPVIGPTWVQIDTVFDLPQALGKDSWYTVLASWQNRRATLQTEESQAQPSSNSGREDCVVQQQLKLEPSDSTLVVVTVCQIPQRGDLQAVCAAKIDARNPAARDLHMFPLTDRHGQFMGAHIKMRLYSEPLALGGAGGPESDRHDAESSTYRSYESETASSYSAD